MSFQDKQGNCNHPHQNRKKGLAKFELIRIPLHQYYKDKAELFLERGKADEIAKSFNGIASYQLRKILNQTKRCMLELEKEDVEFQKVVNILYSVLPLAAYNAGRDAKLKPLYQFLSSHINKNTITCKKDIEVFDELFTSIIAYHKYRSKGGGKHA